MNCTSILPPEKRQPIKILDDWLWCSVKICLGWSLTKRAKVRCSNGVETRRDVNITNEWRQVELEGGREWDDDVIVGFDELFGIDEWVGGDCEGEDCRIRKLKNKFAVQTQRVVQTREFNPKKSENHFQNTNTGMLKTSHQETYNFRLSSDSYQPQKLVTEKMIVGA